MGRKAASDDATMTIDQPLQQRELSLEELERRADDLALAEASGNEAAGAQLKAIESELGERRLHETHLERVARATERKRKADAEAARAAARAAALDELTRTHETRLLPAVRAVATVMADLRDALGQFRAASQAESAIGNQLGLATNYIHQARLLAWILGETVSPLGLDVSKAMLSRHAFRQQYGSTVDADGVHHLPSIEQVFPLPALPDAE